MREPLWQSAVGSGGAIPEIQSTETHWSRRHCVLGKRRNRIPFPADNLSPFDSEKIFTFFLAEFSFSPISLSAAPGRRFGQRCSRPKQVFSHWTNTCHRLLSFFFFLCQLYVWSIGAMTNGRVFGASCNDLSIH